MVLRLLDSLSNWNLEMLVFEEREKLEYPEKPLGAKERTNNKLNPLMASTPGLEPGLHRWEARTLTAAPFLAPRPPVISLEGLLKPKHRYDEKC